MINWSHAAMSWYESSKGCDKLVGAIWPNRNFPDFLMERDNGLGANLGSARHDAVTENAVQGRRLKLRDVIGDRSIEKCDPNAPRIITSG